jgi:hypothetical protein
MGCGVMFGGKCGTATIMEGFWKGMFEMWLETGFLRRISCLSQWCRGGIGLSMLQQLGTGSMDHGVVEDGKSATTPFKILV